MGYGYRTAHIPGEHSKKRERLGPRMNSICFQNSKLSVIRIEGIIGGSMQHEMKSWRNPRARSSIILLAIKTLY